MNDGRHGYQKYDNDEMPDGRLGAAATISIVCAIFSVTLMWILLLR